MPKTILLEKLLKASLRKKHPALLAQILEETDGASIYPAFGSHCLSIFIIDNPYETARRLFEVFLLRGQKFLLTFIMKCVKLKQKKLAALRSTDLLRYLRKDMILECL